MDMPGMPMKMPAQTFTNCVTKEQADKPEPPKGRREGSDCQVYDYKIDGNTVSWKMKCEKQNVTGDGKMTFTGDSYEGVTHVNMGADKTVTTKLTGKRIGDCDK